MVYESERSGYARAHSIISHVCVRVWCACIVYFDQKLEKPAPADACEPLGRCAAGADDR